MPRRDLLSRRPLLLGVVHLPPLPGSPGHKAGGRWRQRAVSDAQAYAQAGFDGVVVENYGDAPFFAGRVPAETSASMAVAAREVRDALPKLQRNQHIRRLVYVVAMRQAKVNTPQPDSKSQKQTDRQKHLQPPRNLCFGPLLVH